MNLDINSLGNGDFEVKKITGDYNSEELKIKTLFNNFRKLQDKEFEIFKKKSISYGLDNITLGLDVSKKENREKALMAVLIRMMDKINRLKQMVIIGNENLLDDEKLEDTYQDLSNYSIISQLLIKNQWKL